MKKYFIIIFIFSLCLSCVFIEPSSLQIDNNSLYDINVIIKVDNTQEELEIRKGKSELIVCYPQHIEMNIIVEQINFSKTYEIDIKYLEKTNFKFDLVLEDE